MPKRAIPPQLLPPGESMDISIELLANKAGQHDWCVAVPRATPSAGDVPRAVTYTPFAVPECVVTAW